MPEKIRLYSYKRVSTKVQVIDGTIKNQDRDIDSFFKYNDEEYVLVGEYKDEGISAFKHRPDYNRMIKDLYNKDEADGIIVQRLDRVGRSVNQLSNMMKKLDENEKIFVCIKQNINTSTNEGKLFFHILAAIAEYNAGLIKERMEEGLQRYIDEGGILGRPRKELDGKVLKKLIKWYNGGLGLRICSNLLKIEEGIIMDPVTVRERLLENKIEMRSPKHRKSGSRISYT